MTPSRWIVAIVFLYAVRAAAGGPTPPESVVCHAVDSYGEPLAIDWPASELEALKSQMAKQIAVLSVHCGTVRVLRNCSLAGQYGFVGTAPMAEQVGLASRQEAADNLLFGGGATLKFVRPQTVSLTSIGNKTATRLAANPADLTGSCAEATHFVRGISLGRFVVSNRDGGAPRPAGNETAACASAKDTSTAPPTACATPLRLRLKRIGDPAVEWQDVATVPGCPKGLVLSEGKCVAAGAARVHQCEVGDREDCVAQCAKNHPGSCTTLALILTRGQNPDLAEAQKQFQAACDAGDMNGCRGLGFLKAQGARGMPKDEGAAALLFQRACEQGNPGSCNYLGHLFVSGQGDIRKDEARAVTLFQRACDGGRGEACGNLAAMYQNGIGVPRDPAHALALLRQACDGDSAVACKNLSGLQSAPPDPAQALALTQRACESGDGDSCANLGHRYLNGNDVTKNEVQARGFYQRSCDAKFLSGCASLGSMLVAGAGGDKDELRGAALARRACDGNEPLGCVLLGLFYVNGSGVARDQQRGKELIGKACQAGYEPGCLALKQVGP